QLHEIAVATRASPFELLHYHTPFRFITAFMTPAQTRMLSDAFQRGSILSQPSLSQSATVGKKAPRFCPSCAKEELSLYGESYWHVRHNLPFVERCPKHGTALLEINRVTDQFSARLPPDECEGIPVRTLTPPALSSWLATQSIATLKTIMRQEVAQWSKHYRSLAESRNFPR